MGGRTAVMNTFHLGEAGNVVMRMGTQQQQSTTQKWPIDKH